VTDHKSLKPDGLHLRPHYVAVSPLPSNLDVQVREQEALTFKNWQHHPGRRSFETLEDDRGAVAQIICWIARPDRPDISLRHLQAFSNLMVKRETGKPHPNFAASPRKKKSEVLKPFQSLERRFLRALTAARMLEHAWSISGGPQQFGAALRRIAPEHVGLDLPPESDERKKRWSDHIPSLHLALVVRTALIIMGYDIDRRPEHDGLLLMELLSGGGRQEWVSYVLLEAERTSYRLYFQGIFDRPERMSRFRLRKREFSDDGEFSPVRQ
jgi:hypothetical protein